MGACLHESGAVRGVLHAVGKHQRFLLGSVEVLVTEQVRQGHRQLGGDGAAEEPDAVSGTAGRTHVVSGLFIGIRPVQGQYRKYLSLNCFGTLWVRCGGLELTVVEVEPPQILHLGGDLRFRGGGDERTEAWRSGGVVGSDGFIGDIERAAGGASRAPSQSVRNAGSTPRAGGARCRRRPRRRRTSGRQRWPAPRDRRD